VSGWQLLALRAAKNIGCDVPAQRIEMALKFVLECRDAPSGGFVYTPSSQPTTSCTGTGILALELCGKDRHHSREALQAGSYLIKNPVKFDDPHFHYSLYYGSQAMFQLGGNYWQIYRPSLHKLLFDSQQRNGGWINNDGVGTSYNTARKVVRPNRSDFFEVRLQTGGVSDGRRRMVARFRLAKYWSATCLFPRVS